MFGLSKEEKLASYLNQQLPGCHFRVTGKIDKEPGFDIWWKGSYKIGTQVCRAAEQYIGEGIAWIAHRGEYRKGGRIL